MSIKKKKTKKINKKSRKIKKKIFVNTKECEKEEEIFYLKK